MAAMQSNNNTITNLKTIFKVETPSHTYNLTKRSGFVSKTSLRSFRLRERVNLRTLKIVSVVHCCSTSVSTSSTEELNENSEVGEGQFRYFVEEYGWKVRTLGEEMNERRRVAYVQSQAFYEPMLLFNDFFFKIFQAEVLSALLYRLRSSPPNRYACLVAEPNITDTESPAELAGVVDVTALTDNGVLQHLPGAQEYLYISGIAVLNNFRRKKVATALLKACDVLSKAWGFEHLVLRAYEDDVGARKLYANAGYNIVSGDPPWMSTWIGRRRRVLMIKQCD